MKPNQPAVAPDPQGAPEPTLNGQLVADGRSFPVSVRCSGRMALRVLFAEERPPAGTRFERLTVRAGGRELTLGACRYDAGPTGDGRDGRLIFLEDVYDVRELLFEGELVSARGALDSLPVVLTKRDEIRPEFRDLVARVTYDLSVFRKFYDEQERLLAGEPPDVVEAARAALVEMERPRFFSLMERHLAELGAVVKDYTREEHERHGFYLRRQAWPYIAASAFLLRTNLKPRGYAGDAEMMQIIYENRYVGATVFERLMHKHPVEHPSAEAVRSRRRRVPQVLREVLARAPRRDRLRFLSVAAGPACELQDVFLSPEDADRFECALLDQDALALAAARENVARLEHALGRPLSVQYLQESVRTMLRRPRVAERFGRYHFIYSMGLFDYLSPPVARAVLANLYDLLAPGGVALIGNYHVDSPSRVYMDYWLDWALYYRTESHFLALAEDLPAARASIDFDDTGSQMFLRIEKGAED